MPKDMPKIVKEVRRGLVLKTLSESFIKSIAPNPWLN